MSKTLTAEQLRSLLAYDRETGLFRWLESRGRVKKGSLAGCVSPTDGYVSLGYFATAEEAHMAYVAAARQHFGEFARAA